MKACTFFGHSELYENIEGRLEEVMRQLIEKESVSVFYVGNHGMFDGVVRGLLYKLMSEYKHLSCYTVLAYLPKTKETNSCLETLFPEGIEKVPPRFAINYRNRWMVENSQYVVVYVINSFGGAAAFKSLAEKKGKTVINIGKTQPE